MRISRADKIAYIVVLLCFLIGSIAIAFRLYQMDQNRFEPKKGWRLTYKILLAGDGPNSKTTIFLPDDQNRYHIYREALSNENFLFDFIKKKNEMGRQLIGIPIKKKKDYSFSGDFYIAEQSHTPEIRSHEQSS